MRCLAAAQLRPALMHAERLGVRAYSAGPCFLTPPRRAGVILGYAGLGEKQIRDGVRLLARALR
jgi:DNA-binding transcriptional MocR family regulator